MGAGCAPQRSPLCAGIEHRHLAKLQICDVMETIADSLPRSVSRSACLWVASALLPALREAQSYEETMVFPAFAREPGRLDSVRRLRAEHVEDAALAEELTEALLSIGHGADIENPEALGYMLRTFFETMRRHIAFEREHVLPLVDALDGPAD